MAEETLQERMERWYNQAEEYKKELSDRRAVGREKWAAGLKLATEIASVARMTKEGSGGGIMARWQADVMGLIEGLDR